MKNLKKLAAGSAIALVIGASAIAGPMSTGSASADGHVSDEPGYFELTSDTDSVGRLQWQDISLKRGITSDMQFDTFESFRTLSP